MKHNVVAVMIGLLLSLTLQDNHTEKKIYALLPEIHPWTHREVVLQSIEKQNQRHSTLQQSDINALDEKWKKQIRIDVNNTPRDTSLIDKVLRNELSIFLKTMTKNSNGRYVKIVVMDNRGLNVGQSGVTDDYWQGDEKQWQKTFLAGTGAIYLNMFRANQLSHPRHPQLSIPISDPRTQQIIGAVTVDINIDKLR